MTTKKMNRREFLKWNIAAALGSSTLYSTLGAMQNVYAAGAGGDYKALVCVFLLGGNDSFNMITPRSGSAYNEYAAARGNLTVGQNNLLPISAANTSGVEYGVNGVMPEVQQLYKQGNLAVVANVGPLAAPTTATQYTNKSVPLPPQLFSHNDQQTAWMAANSAVISNTGWAGRLADLLYSQGVKVPPSLNVSVGNTNMWQTGDIVNQFTISEKGITPLKAKTSKFSGQAAYEALLKKSKSSYHSMVSQYAITQGNSIISSELVSNALSATSDSLQTSFPAGNKLASKLQMVARMIGARNALGSQKQVFFVSMSGWDTHGGQAKDHPGLLGELSEALGAFNTAMADMGVSDKVTTFTASDFGRTLTTNGDGTDHGWGGHALVMGGAVAGGEIYGQMPTLARGGPDEVDNSRIVPTTSVDEYSATLARWFGVSDSDLDLVFPNLHRFNNRNLGFMV